MFTVNFHKTLADAFAHAGANTVRIRVTNDKVSSYVASATLYPKGWSVRANRKVFARAVTAAEAMKALENVKTSGEVDFATLTREVSPRKPRTVKAKVVAQKPAKVVKEAANKIAAKKTVKAPVAEKTEASK